MIQKCAARIIFRAGFLPISAGSVNFRKMEDVTLAALRFFVSDLAR